MGLLKEIYDEFLTDLKEEKFVKSQKFDCMRSYYSHLPRTNDNSYKVGEYEFTTSENEEGKSSTIKAYTDKGIITKEIGQHGSITWTSFSGVATLKDKDVFVDITQTSQPASFMDNYIGTNESFSGCIMNVSDKDIKYFNVRNDISNKTEFIFGTPDDTACAIECVCGLQEKLNEIAPQNIDMGYAIQSSNIEQ